MKQIPMLDLKSEYAHMKQEIDSAIQRCLGHQRWIFGPEIEEFEDAARAYLAVKHCVGVSSGTDALVLSLRAIAIQSGREEHFDRRDGIITTPFTFTATGDAILRAGATPLFVDIDPRTYNIDTKQVSEVFANGGQVRPVGILPVHLYGQASNMDEIAAIAEEHNVFVVEDVAQAFGATWRGKKLGTLGKCGAFSFFPSKNLGGFGDAGMIATDDDEIAELVRMLLKHGGKDKYDVDHIGYNSRLDTLQAAILLAKFKYLDDFNGRRRDIALHYAEELSGIDQLSLPFPFADPVSRSQPGIHEHVFHQYTVCTPMREALRKYLEGNGISTMIYYPVPLHKMKVFQGRTKVFGHLTNAERAALQVLSLPIEPLQSCDDTRLVARCVRNFFQQ